MTLNFLPSKPQNPREPQKCALEGCDVMHTRKGKYCSDKCSQKAKKAREKASTLESRQLKTLQTKREWMSKILAMRDPITKRYGAIKAPGD